MGVREGAVGPVTIYGWDASHYDWSRGLVDVSAAVQDGISFLTHKIGEGTTFTDLRFDDWWAKARKLSQSVVLGAYYVNHPGDQIKQADRFVSLLDSLAPGWRTRDAFILQADAEKFEYMKRAPNLTEIRAFCRQLMARTGGRLRPIVYAPKWVYGDTLRGLEYPLWASSYGPNPYTHYRTAYPGDSSARWGAYSGQVPQILQYGSHTDIGSQIICDANAFRGTVAQLKTLVTMEEQDMTPEEYINVKVAGTPDNPGRTNGQRMGDEWDSLHNRIPALLEDIRDALETLPSAVARAVSGASADGTYTVSVRRNEEVS